MNPQVKTSKSVYITLTAGFALGAVAMAGVFSGAVTTKAAAQQTILPRTASAMTNESMAELRNLDNSFANLAEFVGPAVVDIRSTTTRREGPDGQRMPIAGGEGSGFIYRPDGYIITNDHVVGGFDEVKVTLRDGREFKGTVHRAPDSDIAVVKVDATNLPTLSFADSTKIRPGEFSMAVGAPFGFENSVTVGHVSALGRANQIGNRAYTDLIQTDTPINMGNSGGPLVDVEGQVIGINTAIFSPTGSNAGIGFAIPANRARLIADMLIQNGKVTRAMLGLVPVDLKEYEKKERGLDGGALVEEVSPGGPSDKAGIKKGDVVVKIGSTPIQSEVALRDLMFTLQPSSTVPVEIVRNGKHETVNVALVPYTAPKPVAQEQPNFEYRGPRSNPFSDPFGDFPGFPNMPNFPNSPNDTTPSTPRNHEGPAKLGVGVGDITDSARTQFSIPSNVTGAVVGSVEPDSVGDHIGLRPGDVIESFDGKPVTSAKALVDAMKGVKWGETRQLKFGRFGQGETMQSTTAVTFR